MSYSIQFDVNEEGEVENVTTTHPDTLPRGHFFINGHKVGDEGGTESVNVIAPDYSISANASAVRAAKHDPDASAI